MSEILNHWVSQGKAAIAREFPGARERNSRGQQAFLGLWTCGVERVGFNVRHVKAYLCAQEPDDMQGVSKTDAAPAHYET